MSKKNKHNMNMTSNTHSNKHNKTSSKQSEPPKNTLELLWILIKGFIKGLPKMIKKYLLKSIIILVVVFFGVLLVNTYLLVVKNEGFAPTAGNKWLDITSLKGNIAWATTFWMFASFFISTTITRVKEDGAKQFGLELVGSPIFLVDKIKESKKEALLVTFLTTGITMLLLLLIKNRTILLLYFFIVIFSFTKQKRSFLAYFFSVFRNDIKKISKSKKPVNPATLYLMVFSVAISLLVVYLLNKSLFVILTAVVLIALAGYKIFDNRRVKTALLIIGFLSFTGAYYLAFGRVFADDGGWIEAGGTLEGWIRSEGALIAVQMGLYPSLGAALGALLALLAAMGGDIDIYSPEDLFERLEEAGTEAPEVPVDDSPIEDLPVTGDEPPIDDTVDTGDNTPPDDSVNPGDEPPTDDSADTGDNTPPDDSADTGDEPPTDDSADTGDEPSTDDSTDTGDDTPTDDSADTGDDTPTDDSADTGDDTPTDDSADTGEKTPPDDPTNGDKTPPDKVTQDDTPTETSTDASTDPGEKTPPDDPTNGDKTPPDKVAQDETPTVNNDSDEYLGAMNKGDKNALDILTNLLGTKGGEEMVGSIIKVMTENGSGFKDFVKDAIKNGDYDMFNGTPLDRLNGLKAGYGEVLKNKFGIAMTTLGGFFDAVDNVTAGDSYTEAAIKATVTALSSHGLGAYLGSAGGPLASGTWSGAAQMAIWEAGNTLLFGSTTMGDIASPSKMIKGGLNAIMDTMNGISEAQWNERMNNNYYGENVKNILATADFAEDLVNRPGEFFDSLSEMTNMDFRGPNEGAAWDGMHDSVDKIFELPKDVQANTNSMYDSLGDAGTSMYNHPLDTTRRAATDLGHTITSGWVKLGEGVAYTGSALGEASAVIENDIYAAYNSLSSSFSSFFK